MVLHIMRADRHRESVALTMPCLSLKSDGWEDGTFTAGAGLCDLKFANALAYQGNQWSGFDIRSQPAASAQANVKSKNSTGILDLLVVPWFEHSQSASEAESECSNQTTSRGLRVF